MGKTDETARSRLSKVFRTRGRRRGAIVAVLVVGTIVLGVASAVASAPAKKAGPVVLTMWSGLTGGDHTTYLGLTKEFNATHPGIKLEVTYLPWDSIAQKLPTAMASGSGPDIAMPDYNAGTVREYIKNGLITPINGLLNMVPKSVIAPAILNAFTANGNLYAAPANWATLQLYWNKTLFAKAGIAGPPKTMAQLLVDAKKLTGNGQYGISLADNNTAPMWPIIIWAGGGDIVNSKDCSELDSPKTVSAVSAFATAIHQDGITEVGLSGQDADNLFSAQKAAMEINGPWAAGEYTPVHVNFGIAPVPVGSSGAPVTAALTDPIVVNSKSPHLAQALTFFAWLLQKQQQVYLAVHANYPPARTDMTSDPGLTTNPLVKVFAQGTPYARLFLPQFANFNEIVTNVFTPAIQEVERGANVASTLANASKQLNQLTGCTS